MDSPQDTAHEVLRRWGLSRAQSDALLNGDRRSRRRGRKAGAEPMTEAQRMERVRHILAIHRILSQTFPQAPLLADLWVTTAHPMLNQATPLQIMLEKGVEGMTSIREMLDGNPHETGI